MIKKLNEKELVYEAAKLSFEDGKKVQISGKIEITKSNKNLLVKLTDDYSKSSINQLVFPGNPLFSFFLEHVGQKLPCVADIKYVTNTVGSKQYQAIEIHNIHIDVPSEEEVKAAEEKAEATSQAASTQLSTAIKSIEDSTLRKLCFNIFKNTDFVNKFMNSPATEHSAYNDKSGLVRMTADTINLANSIVAAMNTSFGEESVKFNADLIKAGAILCNVGRAYMLDMEEDGTIVKTEAGVIDTDVMITRDIVTQELFKMSTMVDKEGNPLFNVETDMIKELIHMLVTSKSKLEYNPSVLPRTKHAMLLADIVSMVFTKGLFENLEKNNEGERMAKAYDGGRSYLMF